MAYIQREGGERFVIPSYRDVISKRKNQLKADILELSSKYGEYMTFQRRGLAQFEVAFAHDAGYLFGECVWAYFKRPLDMIYCEAIPDTLEAYLVIVKDNGVYLDGVFPLENIAEELLVFTTQKNNFEVYLYGDTPISQEPAEGKFNLDPASIKSFNILEAPLFQSLPTVKAYQLKLVDVVLREQGIGVFPIKYVIAVAVVIGLGWMGYSFINMHKREMAQVVAAPPPENPYLDYNVALSSPSPDQEIKEVISSLKVLLSLPGWVASDLSYSSGKLTVSVKSKGASTAVLYDWAAQHQVQVNLQSSGFSLSLPITLPANRGVPSKIYSLDRIIANLIDRLTFLMRADVLGVGPIKVTGVFKQTSLTISFAEVSPETVIILAEQLKELPLVLTNLSLRINDGLTGTIVLQALGN